MKRAVFLDLQGTLVLPLAVDSPGELRMISGVPKAVAKLCGQGFLCPVVTVQSRIAKGTFSEGEFREWFRAFARQLHASGALLSGPYICPHRFKDPCACKKPQTLLYEQAARELDIDLLSSFVIGDTLSDVEAAYRFGGRGCLVRTGEGLSQVAEPGAEYPSHVAGSLCDAVEWILHDA
jgi:D-glycero-D-manno-heptose 1,7-bisphosphate phosphatase